ncbi:hypothetical protein M7I_7215 [Glarea lozoyensis 74030]|uniref:Uncharacterized protein n=1 Tax=Glarea lozoyensis (strain ATCC 74030 / MF5533) TaxID=1104152 RepID=H0EWP3_GLAL7|nr:hypothetical protein M7I_7215 [Glarea lozoyensis 74030]
MVRRAFELKRDDVFKGLVKIGIVADSADGADSGRDDENSTPRSQKTADHKQSRDSVKSSRQARVRQTDSASRDASTVRKSSSQTERSESTQTTQSSPFSPRSVRGGKASASAAGMSTQKPREKSAIWGAEDSFA